MSETQRRALVPMLARRARSMHDFLESQAALGAQPWTTLWREGHGEVWRADAEHIAAREGRYSAALGLT